MTGIAVWILVVLAGGVAAQWVAWRFRLPAIVLLFALGLAAGPGLGVLHPARTFGAALPPAVGLAVAVVVFEGGLALDFREWRAAGEGVLRLTTIALPINWVLGTLAAFLVGGLGWGPALLFGAITVVTGPTVVLPMLKHTRLRRRAASFLRWEAILNDPVGAILATLVLEALIAYHRVGAATAPDIVVSLMPRMLGGIALAAAAGILPAFVLRGAFIRDQMPEVLKTPVLLATVLLAYAGCNEVMEGSGLVAATVFGIALANLHVPGLGELRRFKESIVVLMVSALFVVLTADLDRTVLARVSWPIVGLTLAVLFVVRPLAILVATAGSSLTGPERLLAAWIAPRGIVAAAVAGVAGLRLVRGGYPSAELIMPSVFAVIAATMVVHGFSLRPLARRLRLTISDELGVAIVGASGWSVDLASVLTHAGVPTLLVDTFPGALDGARAASVAVLQAELLSQHGRDALEDWPVDYVVATTPDAIYNGLVCASLAPELGRERVFQISPGGERMDGYSGLSRDHRGKLLGRPEWDYRAFERLHEQGWRFLALPGDGDGDPEDAITLMRLRGRLQISISSSEDPAPVLPPSADVRIVLRRGAPVSLPVADRS